MQVGVEIGEQIGMRRGQQKARPCAVGHFAEVGGNHPGQRAIESGREFVCEQPLRRLGQSQRQAETVALSFGQFGRRAEHQLRFSQTAGGEQFQGPVKVRIQAIDQ